MTSYYYHKLTTLVHTLYLSILHKPSKNMDGWKMDGWKSSEPHGYPQTPPIQRIKECGWMHLRRKWINAVWISYHYYSVFSTNLASLIPFTANQGEPSLLLLSVIISPLMSLIFSGNMNFS